jgi:hypothetical protein
MDMVLKKLPRAGELFLCPFRSIAAEAGRGIPGQRYFQAKGVEYQRMCPNSPFAKYSRNSELLHS